MRLKSIHCARFIRLPGGRSAQTIDARKFKDAEISLDKELNAFRVAIPGCDVAYVPREAVDAFVPLETETVKSVQSREQVSPRTSPSKQS